MSAGTGTTWRDEWSDHTRQVVFDGLWERPVLSPRDRSLVTIALLAGMSHRDSLAFHMRRGLDNGLTEQEIAEAVLHTAYYAGWPTGGAAAAVLDEVVAAR